jgi:hypothetical protein
MRTARTFVIGLTLYAVAAAVHPGPARAQSLEDAAAEAAADTAGSLLGLPPPREGPPPPPKRINVARCRRIAKQLVHFANVKDMAAERDNPLWEQATQDHIDQLEGEWWAQCDDHDDEFAQAFSKALRLAAKAALKYFTWGGF